MLPGLRFFRGALLASLSVIGFASTFVAGGELSRDLGISPLVLVFLRFSIAGGTMLIVGLASPAMRRPLLSLRGGDWRRLLWLGPIGTTTMAWCVFAGCARVPVANASMADALCPLGIFAASVAMTRRATPLQIAGLVLGLAGALLTIQVLGPDGLRLSVYGLGDVFILVSAITWGVYTVFGRDDVARIGSRTFSTWTMLIGAALALILIGLLVAGGAEIVWPHGGRAWGLVLFLGLFCTLLPFWTWNAAQNYLPLSVLGMSAYFTPVAAVLLDWMIRGHLVTSWQWLGTLLICASAVVETGRHRR